MPNNLIRQSFVYTIKWLKYSIFSKSIKHKAFVCTPFKCQTVLFDLYIGPYKVLSLQVRLEMGVMSVTGVP